MRLVNYSELCLIAVTVSIAVAGTVLADAPTPFLEGKKEVGDVETASARLIHIGDDVYVVVVRSDTAEYYPIPAKAKEGVVKAEHLGKQNVAVKAKIVSYTKRKNLHPAVELEILSVK